MREQFIKQVQDALIGYGFVQNELEYKRTQSFTQPGQVMIINGQRIDQPGKEVAVEHIVRELGDGYYENIDGSNRVDLVTFEFQVLVDNELQGLMSIAYDYEDIDGFKHDLQYTLNI